MSDIQRRDRLFIQDRATGREVLARVVQLTPSIARRQMMSKWWVCPHIPRGEADREKDRQWSWDKRAVLVEEKDNLFGFALVTAGAGKTIEVQGAVTGDLAFQSPAEPGDRSLYLQWLASHPQNRLALMGDQARFRNAGRGLVMVSLLESYLAGFRGRVTLQALPGTEPFYKKLGFGMVLDSQRKRSYYEIGPSEAQGLLRKEGWI